MILPIKIEENHLLFVEGYDDKAFLEAFGEHLQIEDIQIFPAQGKNEIRKTFSTLTKATGFSNVKSLAVTRDADNDAGNSFRSVCDALRAAGLPVPDEMGYFTTTELRVGVFILPNNKDNGMLEDLCLDSVRREASYKCVDAFEQCLHGLPDKPRIMSKSLAQAYLATQPEHCDKVGMGAKKHYWKFTSKCMVPLKNFLQDFVI